MGFWPIRACAGSYPYYNFILSQYYDICFCFYLNVMLHAHFSVAFKPLMKREYPRNVSFTFKFLVHRVWTFLYRSSIWRTRIQAVLIKWFKSCLYNRSQIILIDMDSGESYDSESDFYHPDEMTNEKENIGAISNEENQQKCRYMSLR